MPDAVMKTAFRLNLATMVVTKARRAPEDVAGDEEGSEEEVEVEATVEDIAEVSVDGLASVVDAELTVAAVEDLEPEVGAVEAKLVELKVERAAPNFLTSNGFFNEDCEHSSYSFASL